MGTFEHLGAGERSGEKPLRHAVVLANWAAERSEQHRDATSLVRQRAAARRRSQALHPSAGAREADVIPFPRRVS